MKLLLLVCSLWVVGSCQHQSSTNYQNPAQSTYGAKTPSQQTSAHGYNSQSTHPDGSVSSQYTYQTGEAAGGSGSYGEAPAAATGVEQQTQVATDTQYAAAQPEAPQAEAAAAVDTANQQASGAEAQTNTANAPEYAVQQTQTVEQQSASSYPTTYTSGSGHTSSNTNAQTPLTYQIVAGGSSGGASWGTSGGGCGLRGSGGSSGGCGSAGGGGYVVSSESGSTGTQTQFVYPAKKPTYQIFTSGGAGSGTRTSQTTSTTQVQYPTFQYFPTKTGSTQTATNTQAQWPSVIHEVPAVATGSGAGSGSGQTTGTTHVQYPTFQFVPGKVESTKTTTNTQAQYPTVAQEVPSVVAGSGAGSGSGQTTSTTHVQYPGTVQYVPSKTETTRTTTTNTQAQYPNLFQDFPQLFSGGTAGSGSSQTTSTTGTQYPSVFQISHGKPHTTQTTTTNTQALKPAVFPVVVTGGVAGSGQTTSTTGVQYPGSFSFHHAKPGSTQTTATNTQAQYPAVFQDVPVVVSGGGSGSGTSQTTTTTTQTQYPGTFNVVSGGGGFGSSSGSTSQGGGTTQFVVVGGGSGGSQRPTYVVYPGGAYPFGTSGHTSHTAQGFYPGGRPNRPSVFVTSPGSGASFSGSSGQTQFQYFPQYYYPNTHYPHSHYFLPNQYYLTRPVVAGGVPQATGATTQAPTTVVTAQPAVVGQPRPVAHSPAQTTGNAQPAKPYVTHGHTFTSSGPATTILTRPLVYQQPSYSYQHPHHHHYQYQFPGQNVVSYVNTYPAATSSQTLGQVSGPNANTTPFRSSHEKGSTYTSYSAVRPTQTYSYSGGPSARYAYQVPVQGALVV